jgi:hypothetical protein
MPEKRFDLRIHLVSELLRRKMFSQFKITNFFRDSSNSQLFVLIAKTLFGDSVNKASNAR